MLKALKWELKVYWNRFLKYALIIELILIVLEIILYRVAPSGDLLDCVYLLAYSNAIIVVIYNMLRITYDLERKESSLERTRPIAYGVDYSSKFIVNYVVCFIALMFSDSSTLISNNFDGVRLFGDESIYYIVLSFFFGIVFPSLILMMGLLMCFLPGIPFIGSKVIGTAVCFSLSLWFIICVNFDDAVKLTIALVLFGISIVANYFLLNKGYRCKLL